MSRCTLALDGSLGAVPHATPRFGEVEPAEAPEVLARHVADAVRRALQESRITNVWRRSTICWLK